MEGAYGLSLPGVHQYATVRWRVPDAGMLSVSIRLEFFDEAFLLKYDGCSGRKIQYGPSRGSDIRFKRSPGGCDASPCRVGDRGIESAGPGNSHTNIFDQKHTRVNAECFMERTHGRSLRILLSVIREN